MQLTSQNIAIPGVYNIPGLFATVVRSGLGTGNGTKADTVSAAVIPEVPMASAVGIEVATAAKGRSGRKPGPTPKQPPPPPALPALRPSGLTAILRALETLDKEDAASSSDKITTFSATAASSEETAAEAAAAAAAWAAILRSAPRAISVPIRKWHEKVRVNFKYLNISRLIVVWLFA